MTDIDRAALLRDFVAAAEGAPLVWGESDCSTWAAQWVRLLTGHSIGLPAYASRAEAHALIAAAGGLVPLWRRALAPIGAMEVTVPELGDVAVCATRRHGEIGLVMAHGGIGYWRTEQGAAAFSPRRLAAVWRLP